ncbi:GntR family transcriptional regulator [Lactobacillus hamsteri]|uniref:GntR family transcriptional regulator n=1 Tax=Lactobacillus hamsteri DSM 5661 = JCM 6256 TaxID=1423754 RepID=A0A0R1Y5A4_9LACO|nr:GntR family transcriptional regulator [Lactobacillus hamsteri]KRM37165.1 GntR family transcriptional regulator [Lactobacillus hamsteri DSM 5661 = JCM 6256]
MAKAKYLEVAQIILDRIKDKTYVAGEPLPNQEILANELDVSRLTVKKALDGLERKGLVYKQSGLGTFVSSDIPIQSGIDSPANMFTGLKNLMGTDNVRSNILHFSVEFPNEQVQKNLSLKKTEPVYNILRLRIVDNQPLIIEHTYMPVDLVPDLSEEILHSSIYNYIHHTLKLKFGHAYRKIKATKSSEYDQKYLMAKKDDPMLELEQIVWLTNGQPIEYSTSRNRYDQRDYTILENTRF